jgi:glycerol-3-phosphate dehydrogenase
VMSSAESLGAVLHVPAEFVGAEVAGAGVVATFRSDGKEHTLQASVLVNAAGPWATAVARRVRPAMRVPDMDLVQGTHVEYDFPMQHGAFYVEAPADGRAVFVLPHGDRTLVGTTETAFDGDPDGVVPLDRECAYLHETLAHHFPERAGLRPVAGWAGLRVLPAGRVGANRRSRETVFVADDARSPRVLSIYGGKLTTWRATAAAALGRIAPSLPAAQARADTAALLLG